MQDKAKMFNFIKLCVIAAVGQQLDDFDINLSDEQNAIIDSIVDSIQVSSPNISEGMSQSDFIFNKTVETLKFIDELEIKYKED